MPAVAEAIQARESLVYDPASMRPDHESGKAVSRGYRRAGAWCCNEAPDAKPGKCRMYGIQTGERAVLQSCNEAATADTAGILAHRRAAPQLSHHWHYVYSAIAYAITPRNCNFRITHIMVTEAPRRGEVISFAPRKQP